MSTPSHGGFKLSAALNLLIPAAFRHDGGWYEEDCDAAIPMFFMPTLFKPDEIRTRSRVASQLALARVGSTLTESPCHSMNLPAKRRRLFIEEHANDLLVISASGDWHRAVPKGMVGVTATIQGSREPGSKHRHFLVSKDEYDTRQSNPGGIFVIDPAHHQTWDPQGRLRHDCRQCGTTTGWSATWAFASRWPPAKSGL